MAERRRNIAVIGLGYVGLPLAIAFRRAGFSVIGFDVDPSRIEELRRHVDRTREVGADELQQSGLRLTGDARQIRSADFFIVTVPTPIDDSLSPDISMLLAASRTVGGVLKPGDIVVYESTVYPGATEEDCLPVLEQASGLRAGVDFAVGYSPERINPGDREHTFESITKVVSAQDERTRGIIAATYGAAVKAGVYLAPSIMVAEAAKVIENTQRDLNIALMNELSLIFARMKIDTTEVLAAAATKWNFLRFAPGLVGGHCIGVDPYYLTHKARRLGYHAEVVLAGRRVNDEMPRHVAREAIRRIVRLGCRHPLVTVLGITFKENVPDIRNSKVVDLIAELISFGVRVQIYDPQAYFEDVEREYGLPLQSYDRLEPADGLIVAVAHAEFRDGGWGFIQPLLNGHAGFVLDVKGVLDKSRIPDGVDLWRM
ncbi:MAG TPA: nucleotide sugar dehydrogenase [Stellaceae bacterium]|nr:nucleotide sugar dehydrogenase [Stellaceae bacterium]